MTKKGYTTEQIINKLREAEILLNQGATIAVVSKKIGVSEDNPASWTLQRGILEKKIPSFRHPSGGNR